MPRNIEKTIVNTLKYFGPMDKWDIQDCLDLVGVKVTMGDLEHSLFILRLHQKVKTKDLEFFTLT